MGTVTSLFARWWNTVPALEEDEEEADATKRYRPLRKHPELFQARVPATWVAPELLEIVNACKSGNAKKPEICSALRVEVKDVYSFLCFSPEFVKLFVSEIENFYASGIPARRPNSMNNYGVIVNEIGMRPMITEFQQQYIWPIAKVLFPEEASQFDSHHSFIVRYTAAEDLGLDMHTDDSDVTFNVCLGYDFTGATLTFCGYMGAPDHRQATHVYSHEIGRAVLHLGSRRHGADDIENGTRMNLIIWSHNSAWRRAHPSRLRREYYSKEAGPPDPVCLSYTHDRDFLAYKEKPSGRASGRNRAWCPPPGKEYENFPDSDETM
ncbi:unnamed protein product [Effrenium voratum]|uniref:Fe2OG dioxygenase domain-containing protein n=1 Tax=Effrenium voratum TaxID=2562239 RepID=A0AA36J3T7_9DINO|nr:unnamed protein product [Effrenium voratum]CAJ1451347.1 unnamed protein product [Effrenium voratum]